MHTHTHILIYKHTHTQVFFHLPVSYTSIKMIIQPSSVYFPTFNNLKSFSAVLGTLFYVSSSNEWSWGICVLVYVYSYHLEKNLPYTDFVPPTKLVLKRPVSQCKGMSFCDYLTSVQAVVGCLSYFALFLVPNGWGKTCGLKVSPTLWLVDGCWWEMIVFVNGGF